MKSSNLDSIYSIVPGNGNLPKLELTAPDGARAEVYLHGAHVTAWTPAGGNQRLFLSRKSQFEAGEPIRGGVPVAFPQFSILGPLPLHGLARLMAWEFVTAQVIGERAQAVFRLHDTDASRAQWPHAFQTELTVSTGGNRLEVTLAAANPGPEPFDFTAALHTYLSVSDSAATHIAGLGGRHYRENGVDGVDRFDGTAQVGFPGEVNRIYFDTPAEVRLVESQRTTVIRQTGFTDTVLWNPGAEKCAGLPDLEPEDYRRFVCVEAAVVRAPVHLDPGEQWQGSQELVA